jgi:hypothetical protein
MNVPDVHIAYLMQLENDLRRMLAVNGIGKLLGMPAGGITVHHDPASKMNMVFFQCDPNSAETAELRRLLQEQEASLPPPPCSPGS